MALKPQLSFSSGEIDPILHDRSTLERFQNGLATARNVMIGKTGSVMSRFGSKHLIKAKHDDIPIQIFSMTNSDYFLEFGVYFDEDEEEYVQYIIVRRKSNGEELWEFNSLTNGDLGFTPFDIIAKNLQFVQSRTFVYVFGGSNTSMYALRITYDGFWSISYQTGIFNAPAAPTAYSFDASTDPAAYQIIYAFTYVRNGQESLPSNTSPSTIRKPNNATAYVNLEITLGPVSIGINNINEVRIYQRPREGAAFGFLGRTTDIYVDGAVIKANFKDLGFSPDFGNGLPSQVLLEGNNNFITNLSNAYIGTGAIYQQRLILGNLRNIDDEAILASRPGHQNNFYRDFPYDADSALRFKAGSSGTAKVLRIVESEGLVVFTTIGVFVSLGILSANNLALDKRGNWVIDERVPPLLVPGALFFVDKSTNSIRELSFSQERGTYIANNQSVFSDHLFKERRVVSWAYQEGESPLIIVSFSDGKFAIFTYDLEHQMKAWTRQDSILPIEQVESTHTPDQTFLVVNKNGTRYIDVTVPRFVPYWIYEQLELTSIVNILEYSAFADSIVRKVRSLFNELRGNYFEITPVTPDDWEGLLSVKVIRVDPIVPGIFFPGELGEVGVKLRYFDKDQSSITLTIEEVIDAYEVIVSSEFNVPENINDSFIDLYAVHNEIDGLEHLEGEQVSVVCDGIIVSSPYNDNYDDTHLILTVTDGKVILPLGIDSAVSLVGRPIVADIETLNVSTVEQSPVTIESMTVNKLYVRVHESKGLFVANEFPENKLHEKDGTSVKDMENLLEYDVPDNVDLIANRPKPYVSKRVERTLPGSWENNGKQCFRQVDPYHFQILSIIADIEIATRSNR